MITAHLASIPERQDSLYLVLKSLRYQVDRIYVALNVYNEIPTYWNEFCNVIWRIMDNGLGDAAKFSFINEIDGLVLICDDDLIYPFDYAQYMGSKVKQYNCPVSLHGKKYDKRPIENFRSYTKSYHCLSTTIGDHDIDVIGTGVLAFDTSMIRLSTDDFPVKNMADVWFSKVAHNQGVPLKAIEHDSGFLKYIYQKRTIWNTTRDYRVHTEILNEFLK